MTPRARSLAARFALALIPFLLPACSEPSEPEPVLTDLSVTIPSAALQQGETQAATAAGTDQDGDPIPLAEVVWSTSDGGVAVVSQAGVVKGVGGGTARIFATSEGRAGAVSVTVAAPAGLKVNEVESNGGTPGDWIELFNPTAAPVAIGGWVVKDNDDTHVSTIPAGTTIAAGGYYVVEEAQLGFGLGAADAARVYNPFGVLVDAYDWSAHAAVTYGRCPNGTGGFAPNAASTKGAANDCKTAVRINEVESNGGVPGDWIELYNPGAAPADLSGYVIRDNDDTHTTVLPANTSIAAGGFLVIEEATLGYGLGAADAARLFAPGGTSLVDAYEWTAHAAVTYGRCPDGTGVFGALATSTKGTANACGPITAAWPGADDAATVDGVNVFGTNMSGLTYEGAAAGAPAVLWAVQNGPGTLYRLIFDGTIWTPDPANGWRAGKPLRYKNGTGNPDSEGVTFAEGGAAGGIYVATERNNDASTVSRNVVIRVDPTAAGTTLTATQEWDLTADLPAVGANLGIEAITWVSDAYLTAQGFVDETANKAYAPGDYPNHGTGLFFVGVEGNGNVYVYALDQLAGTAKRIAVISTGFGGVMSLEFDRELNDLWAGCDDGCGNKFAVMEIDGRAGSSTRGKFQIARIFDRPASLPNVNNEGFAIAPQSECVGGLKPAFWADDNNTGGHAIRRARTSCTGVALTAPSRFTLAR